eukprot:1161488-Pelagomonas_calceolata.AAC.5
MDLPISRNGWFCAQQTASFIQIRTADTDGVNSSILSTSFTCALPMKNTSDADGTKSLPQHFRALGWIHGHMSARRHFTVHSQFRYQTKQNVPRRRGGLGPRLALGERKIQRQLKRTHAFRKSSLTCKLARVSPKALGEGRFVGALIESQPDSRAVGHPPLVTLVTLV